MVPDAHNGLNVRWHRCRVVSALIGTGFAQDTAQAARTQWRQVADQLRPRTRKLAEMMDEGETYMDFPAAWRRRSPKRRCCRDSSRSRSRISVSSGRRER